MKQRFITGIISSIIFVTIILSNPLAIKILCAVVSFWTLLEIYTAIGIAKNWYLMGLGLCISVGSSFGFLFGVPYLFPLLFAYILLLFLGGMTSKGKITLADLSKSFFLTIYICFCFSAAVLVSDLPNGDILIWFVFAGAWVTDSFAYLVGVSIGKHKIFPNISPKKTWEGAIGGIVGTSLILLLVAYILTFFGYTMNYLLVALFAIISAVFAQMGDLAASYIKRECGIKDFGSVLPGHGGIMDRADSILFVAPIAYIFLQYLGSMLIQ